MPHAASRPYRTPSPSQDLRRLLNQPAWIGYSPSHAMISTHEILEKSRAASGRLPYNEAAVLFAGAVRLAAASDSTLRGRFVRIDDAGGLHVEGFDEQAPEAEPAYLAAY